MKYLQQVLEILVSQRLESRNPGLFVRSIVVIEINLQFCVALKYFSVDCSSRQIMDSVHITSSLCTFDPKFQYILLQVSVHVSIQDSVQITSSFHH